MPLLLSPMFSTSLLSSTPRHYRAADRRTRFGGQVVDSIATISGSLLAIVNYNVEASFQLHFLFHSNSDCLLVLAICLRRRTCNTTNVLNFLKVQKIDIAKEICGWSLIENQSDIPCTAD
jgi:hypothetical protein